MEKNNTWKINVFNRTDVLPIKYFQKAFEAVDQSNEEVVQPDKVVVKSNEVVVKSNEVVVKSEEVVVKSEEVYPAENAPSLELSFAVSTKQACVGVEVDFSLMGLDENMILL